MGYSFQLAARVLLYASSHRQDSTYHSLCYISRGALAETRNSSMGPFHEGSIRRPIAPWANALTTELHLAPMKDRSDDPSRHERTHYHEATFCSHEGSIRQPIAPWANALTTELHLAPMKDRSDDTSHHERTPYHEATSCSSVLTRVREYSPL